MKSLTTAHFWKHYDTLPPHVQAAANRAYLMWRENPYHPSLQFKRLAMHPETFSVRVGRSYRALGRLKGDSMIWFWIGSHAEYDQIIT